MGNGRIEVSVVIPSYNEKENIPVLIQRVEKALKKCRKKFEVIIVDDNSPDGTAQKARMLNKKYKNIRVFVRKKKEGVGSAYYYGYKKGRGRILIGMDADLSHDPDEINKLLGKLEEGYDMVLGSRHIHGAFYEHKKFDTFRKYITSRYGNILTSFILGIGIKDFTNGFRCFKKEIINSIKLVNKGNSLLMEIIAKAYWKGYRIAEVPTNFRDRKKGYSKLKLIKEPLQFLKDVLQLKKEHAASR